MGPEIPSSRVDQLAYLALLSAIHDSLPRKRRARLLAKLLAIAEDWEREENVIDLAHPRLTDLPPKGLRAAADRLRSVVQLLRPKRP